MRPNYPIELFNDLKRLTGIPEGGRILEIGCGTGQATLPLLADGYEMTCLDIGEKLLEVAEKKAQRYPEVRIIDLTQMSAVTVSSLFLRPNDVVYVQPRAMKGYNMAFQEIAPPFQLISTMLQPFVNIRYLTK